MTNGELIVLCGGFVGVLGGLSGTLMPIRNMKLPALRRWYLRALAIGWCALIAFSALTVWLQRTSPQLAWMGWLLFGPFLVFESRYISNGMKKFKSEGESATQSATKEQPNADGN